MIFLISGSTHVGKTFFSNELMKKKQIPYISIDHIKMGLIRSGLINVKTDDSDELITNAVWPVTKEIIKTAIENKQDLIIEGCYIPFDYKKDFDDFYLKEIKYLCLILSDRYIEDNFNDILKYENCIEKRMFDSSLSIEFLKKDNKRYLNGCIVNKLDYCLINKSYYATIFKVVNKM